jgi:hypothetical protein
MEIISNKEKLEEFARLSGRVLKYSKKSYPLSSYRKFERFKTTAWMPCNPETPEKGPVFVWLSDPYYMAGSYTSFSGVFMPLDIQSPRPLDGSLVIRKKYFFDKISLFSRKKEDANDLSRNFTSQVVITGNSAPPLYQPLKDRHTQSKLIDVLDLSDILRICINQYDIDFVPSLQDRPTLGFVNQQEWITDKTTLNKMIGLANDTFKSLNLHNT